MRRSAAICMIIALALVSFFALQRRGDASGTNNELVTFNKDVAPILYARCVECHRSGQMAPMSLVSFKEVRPWAKSIREKVLNREMPPWYADPHYGQFLNDPRLTEQEVATIRAWVDGGSKEGDEKDLPQAPKFRDTGWKFGQPDAVFSLTEEASIPADGTVPYRYWAVPTNFTEDKYIQYAEIKRGAPSVIHHVIISVREPGDGKLPPAGEINLEEHRSNGETSRASQNGRERNSNPDSMLVGWAPGMTPLELKPGEAKLIKKGSVLIFQMHYTTSGLAAKDRTSVGLWFSKGPVKKRVITRGIFTDQRKLAIPPGDPNYESTSTYTFTENAHIESFMPHMHVRGKDFEYKLFYPDGKEEVLLRVPKYDFNWQLYYYPMKPIAIPKGARIDCVAHHDNSAANKFNPDPNITVHWGDQTWEEMMIGWIDYTIDDQDLRAQARTETASNK